ncbi:MAG: YceI family protein [Rhodomicrobium sp.]
MKPTLLAPLAVSAFLAMLPAASADPSAYTFDPTHTEIRFCWNHLGFSRQCAHFLKYDGELLYDEANPENSTLKVTFKTDSIETLVPQFNEHMKDKLFDVERYPEATFKSTKFKRTGENTGKVTGDLTIHGVTNSVTLDVTLNRSGLHPISRNLTLGVGAKTEIDRTDFGVSEAYPFVPAEISIEIQTEMFKKS